MVDQCSVRRWRPLALALLILALLPARATLSDGAAVYAQPAPPRQSDAPRSIDYALPPPVSARSAVVIDGASGALLMDKRAHLPLPPASLTKIVTALVTLQRADPKRRVITTVRPWELDPDSTLMGLNFGDELTIEDLLYGLLLPSGNDAALALGRAVSGSDSGFVALMNQAAQSLNLRDTRFVNAHGLDDPGQRTSAYDIAQLTREAMRDDRFRQMVATKAWTVHSQRSYLIRNRNPFLGAYPGSDGVKIGWTEAAGNTIVASATRNGHQVIVALMDTNDRVRDSAALMDWAFTTFRWTGGSAPSVAGAPAARN